MKHRRERGSALIESALVLPLLLMLAIGAAEAGYAWTGQMTASDAARQGARIGAAMGTEADADLAILVSVERAMCDLNSGSLSGVAIYKADSSGSPVDDVNELNFYVPAGALTCSGTSTSLVCANGCTWTPDLRSDLLTSLDDIGVEIYYTHEWISGFVFDGGTSDWTEQAVMRIEPDSGSRG
jgi:hypothetical protein